VQEAFDLAISPLPPPDSTLIRRRLATLSLILCGAPAYLERHPVPQSPADLAGHNCLRYPYAPFPDEWHFLDARENTVVARISGSLISSSPETTRAAAVAGIGLVLTVPFLVADLLASGALAPLLPGYRTQEVEINALYPHRRHLSAKVRAFIDMLVDHFSNGQRWLDAKAEQ
jgi:DNA-binding transcriptional LysR family regulator